MHYVWKAVILSLGGFMLLRIAGRKSIAQVTIPTTVVMVSIGSILIQPIVEDSVVRTLAVAAIFVAVLIVVEYLEVKFNLIEKLMTGDSITVIDNGQLVIKNMARLRLTVDKLEMKLRQQGISSIADIKTATIEPNGQLGYELVPDAQPLTVGEFKQLMKTMLPPQQPQGAKSPSIFDEVTSKGKSQQVPQRLQ